MSAYNFFRRGGLDQLRIEKTEDLTAVETLDPKLWVALSMPVANQELDPATLALLDTDADGRIRVPEIVAAVKFIRAHLKNFDGFFAGKDTVELASFAENSALLPMAKSILARQGKPDATGISLADVAAESQIFNEQSFNGDGILVPACAEDSAELADFIRDATAATGGTPDASGKTGISPQQAADFLAAVEKTLAWRSRADAEKATLLPFGENTAAAFSAFSKIRAKVDDFFARSRLAAFDETAVAKLNPSEGDFSAIAGTEIATDASKAFPLARIVPATTGDEPALPLTLGLNPAWADAVADFVEKVLVPAEPNGSERPVALTASKWAEICAKFAPYRQWLEACPDKACEAFSTARLQEIASGNFLEKLAPLFERDAGEKPLRDAFADTERLCRYSRDLAVILRNFVSFSEFYKRNAKDSAFLVGKLFMDSRTCSLCVRVADAGAHAALATKSNCCLAYCECSRRGGSEKMTITAIFGDGDSLSLYVGRNGVFYDKNGNDWDAKIVKLIENPISIREAFWTPYRKLAKFVETQVSNFASAREQKVDSGLSSGAGTALSGAAAGTPASAPKPAFDVAKFAGIFAAIGLALGAIGAALAAGLSGFLQLAPWQMVLVIVAVILLISAPSMLIAAMKLRRRSLGPILEANGWAINGNVKINIPLGKTFTEMPKKPAGSHTSRVDPYEQKPFPWKKILGVLIVLALASIGFALWEKYTEEPEPKADETAENTPTEPAVPAENVPAAEGVSSTPVEESVPAPEAETQNP